MFKGKESTLVAVSKIAMAAAGISHKEAVLLVCRGQSRALGAVITHQNVWRPPPRPSRCTRLTCRQELLSAGHGTHELSCTQTVIHTRLHAIVEVLHKEVPHAGLWLPHTTALLASRIHDCCRHLDLHIVHRIRAAALQPDHNLKGRRHLGNLQAACS